MRKLAHEAIASINEQLGTGSGDSRCADANQVYMAAMAAYIQELEEALVECHEQTQAYEGVKLTYFWEVSSGQHDPRRALLEEVIRAHTGNSL